MAEIPARELVDCVDRELKMRRRVYPRWVEAGRMTQKKADYEIACMEAILKRMQDAAAGERLL